MHADRTDAVQGQDDDEQPHKNAMAACSCEPDGFNVVEVHLATILSTIAAAFKPRRAPARLPTSLACRLTAGGRIERVFISPRWRRPTDGPNGGSVLLDRDDSALAGNSDQDESPISAPVVWLALRRAELDCCAWYRTLIGRVAFAEDPQEHKQCHSLTIEIACASWPLLVIGVKSRFHSLTPPRGVLSVNAFHEKAGRSQVGSFVFSLDNVFSPRRVTTVATLPSALFVERFALGASWVFSFQPVLPPDCRPLFPLPRKVGPGVRRSHRNSAFGLLLFLS